ncbi:hypothetical protein [Ochrovirga pacifica]|uniref:hypothetical protein n=1 Tax=Ochrovirga pacifica TaxID=1042376 RepID=UPI000255874E|nr:hypothetical protein [Ochrovirga pacifica]
MKAIYILTLLMCTLGVTAQETSDQNPNYQRSYEKYAKLSQDYVNKQGTTAQQTYVAIDLMEEKRIRKKMVKDHRAMRRLWRHEERMEAAKNTKYRVYHNGYSGWNTNIGIGIGARRGFSVYSGIYSPFWGYSPRFCR